MFSLEVPYHTVEQYNILLNTREFRIMCSTCLKKKCRTIFDWNPLLMIFLFCKEMIGGSLKFFWSYGWFCIRFHFFIQASFIVDTEGWYCVTNDNISFSSLLFCFGNLESLLWILFLIVGFLSKFVGSLRPSSVFLKCEFFSQRLFLRSFFAGFSRLPLDKSFFNTWKVTRGEMCVQEGFCL